MRKISKILLAFLAAAFLTLLRSPAAYAELHPPFSGQQEGTLKLQLKEVSGEKAPVAGVRFTCFPVGSFPDSTDDMVQYQLDDDEFAELLGLGKSADMEQLMAAFTSLEPEQFDSYITSHNGVRTDKTDQQGHSEVRLSCGLYLVAFSQVPSGYQKGVPFLVSLPMLVEQNGKWSWTDQPLVTPKIEKKDKPDSPDNPDDPDTPTPSDKYGTVALTKTFQGKPAEDPEIYKTVTFQLEHDTGEVVYGIDEGNGRYRAVTGQYGEHVFRVGSDGKLIISSLPYGDYVFTELTTHEKYQLLAEPEPVTVVDATNAFTVDNRKKSFVPFTGGRGTSLLTGIGVILCLCGIFILLRTKKKKRKKRRRQPQNETDRSQRPRRQG